MEKMKKKVLSSSLLLEHKVLHNMAEGVLVTDHKGKIVFLNRPLEKIFKIPRNVSDIKDFQKILAHSMDQRKSSRNPKNTMKTFFTQPPKEKCFVFFLKNEKVYECLSRPQNRNGRGIEGVYFFHEIPKNEKVKSSAGGKNIHETLTEAIRILAARSLSDSGFWVGILMKNPFFHRLAGNQMLFNNSIQLFTVDIVIPDSIGLNANQRSGLANPKTANLAAQYSCITGIQV